LTYIFKNFILYIYNGLKRQISKIQDTRQVQGSLGESAKNWEDL